jgi:hypothetical protein
MWSLFDQQSPQPGVRILERGQDSVIRILQPVGGKAESPGAWPSGKKEQSWGSLESPGSSQDDRGCLQGLSGGES